MSRHKGYLDLSFNNTKFVQYRIFEDRDPIEEYGIHPQCKECLTRRKCKNPQYNPGESLTFFYCRDYQQGAKHGKN